MNLKGSLENIIISQECPSNFVSFSVKLQYQNYSLNSKWRKQLQLYPGNLTSRSQMFPQKSIKVFCSRNMTEFSITLKPCYNCSASSMIILSSMVITVFRLNHIILYSRRKKISLLFYFPSYFAIQSYMCKDECL